MQVSSQKIGYSDVEAIINEGREEPKFPGENLPEAKGDVGNNYVIFEEQDIEIGNINELIVGRQYPESGAQVFDEAWCYVNLDTQEKHLKAYT